MEDDKEIRRKAQNFFKDMRRYKKLGTLSVRKQKALETIEGWFWDVNSIECKKYRYQKKIDVGDAKWIKSQASLHRAGSLDKWKSEMLISNGVDLRDSYLIRFTEKCNEVKSFIDANGLPDPDTSHYEWIVHNKSKLKNGRMKESHGEYFTELGLDKIELGNKRKGKVAQVSLDVGLVKVWDFAAQASEDGFSKAAVGMCLKGKMDTHKGFKWMYLEDYKKLNSNGIKIR